LHSSRQNNHRRRARISEPGAPDSARSWPANLGRPRGESAGENARAPYVSRRARRGTEKSLIARITKMPGPLCAAPPRATPPSIRNQKSSINNSHGSPDPSIQARVAGCPVLARSLRKGGFAAKSRKSRFVNESKSFGRVRSTLRPILPSIRNQKSSINNSRVSWPAHVGAGALTCSAERSSAMHCKQAGRLTYSSARTKTTHVGAGAPTC
jgi:hypothetical protein